VPLRGILLLVFFCISLPVCFIRPFYGILLWSVVAFLNPQSFIWSARYSFPWALAVAIPTLAGVLLFSRGWTRLASREFYLLVTLWIWFTVTSVVSAHTPFFAHHAQDTLDRWQFVSKVLLMTVVTMAIVDSFARLRIFVLVMAGCFAFYVLKALPFMILTGGAYRLYGPQQSMIADNNDFGLALNMTLPLFFFLAQTESRRWVKRLFGFLFLITIPAIFFTYSRGDLIGLVAVLVLMFFQLKRRMVLVAVVILGSAIAVLFAPERWQERMDPTRADAVDASARSRLNAWTFSWRLALDFPVMGGGFETFTPELFSRYAPNARDVHGPHSIYFGILAEHGFVGLFLYLGLLLSYFVSSARLMKLARFHGDRVVVNYVHMFRFSLVGFLVSGLFLGRAYFDYFFTILACISVLKRMCLLEWAGPVPGGLEEEAA
jgi:probable O-glycosylation ligase (exosortase A-associated)